VTCLEFLDPYPLLLVCDASGAMRAWLTRPLIGVDSRCVLTLHNTIIAQLDSDEVHTQHTCRHI
jgi:hypothetical protein